MGSYRTLTGLIERAESTHSTVFRIRPFENTSLAVPKTLNPHRRKAFQMCIVRVQRLRDSAWRPAVFGG